jgi:NAD(P)-dependent dehydrogenase (short-subunit alcohol dehydrogenase family)
MLDTNAQTLSGKRALVTGGSRGIGRSIALALAAAGADVALTARRQPELDVVVAEVRALGRLGLGLTCDVTDPDQVQQLADTLNDELGGVEILINNAGRAQSHKFLNHPDDLWHALVAVNLTSVYYVTKAIVPAMVAQRWGRVINIASTASKIGGRYIAAYTATKHGVLGLTRSLALELVDYQITVNAICPGYVDTPMTETNIANIAARTGMSASDARAALEKVSPQKRLIEPEEVAAVAVMLAQEESRGITGQAINVDGGTVMW